MTDLVVRVASPDDRDAILGVEATTDDPWSASAVEQEFAVAGAQVHVAVVHQAVIGWVSTRIIGDSADLLRVAVHPSARRRGVARSLLHLAAVQARADGAQRWLLEVAEDNHPARGLYANLGHRPIGRRRHYYGPGRDALVLEWNLSPQSVPPDG